MSNKNNKSKCDGNYSMSASERAQGCGCPVCARKKTSTGADADVQSIVTKLKELAEAKRLMIWDPASEICMSGSEIKHIYPNGSSVLISLYKPWDGIDRHGGNQKASEPYPHSENNSNPETVESLKKEIEKLNWQEIHEGHRYDKLRLRYGYLIDEINGLDNLLKKHGIPYDPNNVCESKENCESYLYAEGSLFERRFVVRESLRRSDEEFVFKIVKYRLDNPCVEQEKILKIGEAVDWLISAGATDDEIFKITGEKRPIVDAKDLPF